MFDYHDEDWESLELKSRRLCDGTCEWRSLFVEEDFWQLCSMKSKEPIQIVKLQFESRDERTKAVQSA
jgi:hypothetical protein